MTIYFVMGIATVAWALVLAVLGLTRDDFPPSGAAGRTLALVSALLVAGTLTALFVTTHKEHPREEAAKKATERASFKRATGTENKGPAPSAKAEGGGTVSASEKEYSIGMPTSLKAGEYAIDVSNVGKIQHNLAVEGAGVKETKTPLIDPQKKGKLTVDLKPGKYTFLCTVPGHEQLGMKVEVTVR